MPTEPKDSLIPPATTASDPTAKPPLGPTSDGDRLRAMELAFASEESASTMIGPYKLLQEIGEGGFGTVWMAEQKEPVRRRVAVKVIKSGMDTREVVARFEVERQALALMDHPNIARVFDAGSTDAGRPYFVMELVRGVPITKYCDENRVPTEARLKLFIAVCHAVQHAHQKGIIHRDLKPSNIIVTLHDGVPMPKIIDFGIAKATETPLTEKTLFTQFHAFIGTPAYTSPEQMELSGLDVDTRSDIYSLGILLYELLAGRPPFDPDALLKSGLEEMRRTIREVDPPRPSHHVGTYSDELRSTVARQRGIDAVKLPLLLRGDLDWIVMHCLEKDRTRRYDTATALATDVRHYLNDEPVSARPPSSAYRFRKFIRRHKLGFAAGAAVALSLIAGLVTASVLLVRERAARERAVAAEATQSVLRRQSEQVAQFLTDMLNGVGPSVALGRDTALMRDILDRTTRHLDTELRDQPAVAADLRATLGGVYLELGEYAKAEPLLRAAVAAQRTTVGNEGATTAKSLHLLGITLRLLNKTAEAETVTQEALAIRRKIFGAAHPLVADTLYQLVWVLAPHRTTTDRRTMMEEVLDIRRKAFGPEHADVAQAIYGLGSLAQMDLDHELAVRLHREALALRRRLLGNDHPDVAASLDAIGYSCAHVLDRKSEAAAAYGEAFAIRRKVLGDQHPQMVVSLLRFTGQQPARDITPETLELVRGFVASQRKLLPRGSTLLALATLEDRPDRYPAEAHDMVREARLLLDEARRNGSSLEADLIRAMGFFTWSKFIGNQPDEGVIMGEEAMKLAQAAFGADGRGTLMPSHILAWTYLALGREAEAASRFETAARLGKSAWGQLNPLTLVDIAALGDCYRATDRVAEAHQLLAAELAACEAASQTDVPHLAYVLAEYGLLLVREARFAEAEAMLRRALVNYDRSGINSLGLRLRPRQLAVSGLGQALAGQGKFAEAEPLVVQAFEELQANEHRIAGDRAGIVRAAHDAVIALYAAWEKPDKTAEWKQKLGEEPGVHP